MPPIGTPGKHQFLDACFRKSPMKSAKIIMIGFSRSWLQGYISAIQITGQILNHLHLIEGALPHLIRSEQQDRCVVISGERSNHITPFTAETSQGNHCHGHTILAHQCTLAGVR